MIISVTYCLPEAQNKDCYQIKNLKGKPVPQAIYFHEFSVSPYAISDFAVQDPIFSARRFHWVHLSVQIFKGTLKYSNNNLPN